MQIMTRLASLTIVSVLFTGCGPGAVEYEETTDAFVGRLVQNGEPVTLPGEAVLNMIHHGTSDRFGIPLKSDGSFEIGWMPTGDYSAELKLQRRNEGNRPRGAPNLFNVPGPLSIEKDKNEYEIELGEKWKP
ncbi:hypothetical protein OAS39_09640 [Pirellulales bacterium]|nr:hypothetical protein [Pirellulales bacterium]